MVADDEQFTALAIRSGKAALPAGVSWAQLWGVSCLAGIGFRMAALF